MSSSHEKIFFLLLLVLKQVKFLFFLSLAMNRSLQESKVIFLIIFFVVAAIPLASSGRCEQEGLLPELQKL